jgi:hypothetical protein
MRNTIFLFLCLIVPLVCYTQEKDVLLSNGKYCSEVLNDSISKKGFYIPANINECDRELDNLLDSQPKDLLANAKDVELKRIYGMYIFGEWTEDESTRLCCYFRSKGIESYDDREYLILLSYKKYLLKQNFDIDIECNKIKLYHDSIAKEKKIRHENNIIADSIDGVYIPKNLEDCFPTLDKLLNNKDKSKMKKAEDISDFHFGLGRWMRNSWGLWGGSRLQLWFHRQDIINADNMSGVILSAYQEYLKKGFVDTQKILMEIKKEQEEFDRMMQESSSEAISFEFDEEDYYSDEYKDFLKRRRIDGIFILR